MKKQKQLKELVKRYNEHKDEQRVVDYRLTEIGRQNWEVCARMLVHDLLDLSVNNPELKKVLDYYCIGYRLDGGYSMALPRLLLKK